MNRGAVGFMVSGQSLGQFESRMRTGCIHPHIAGRGSCGPSGRWRVCAVWGWGLLLVGASLAWAGSGGNVVLPQAGRVVPRPSGLRLEISSYWVEGNGYRPVTVEVSSPLPAIADRTLTISLAPVDYLYYQRTSQEVRFELVLPQGARRATCTVSVPQRSIWQQWRINVYEDGLVLDDLSGMTAWPRSSQYWSWSEAYPCVLVIDRDAPAPRDINQRLSALSNQPVDARSRDLPDLRLWWSLMPPDPSQLNSTPSPAESRAALADSAVWPDTETLTRVQSQPRLELLPPAELSDQWIDYTCFDLILVSLSDLLELSRTRPDAWTALRRHITTGGNLLVTGVGDQFERLTELDQLLALPAAVLVDQQSTVVDGWSVPSPERFGKDVGRELRWGVYAQSYGPGGAVTEERDDDAVADAEATAATVPTAWFRARGAMMGCVVAIGPQELSTSKEDVAQHDWILASLSEIRWQWYRRHGLSQVRMNDGFWDFLIPGVGAAPVKAFLCIISAFVLAIGPLNYWLLRKWNRLYLLLITVPTGAAVVTGCLFLYAVLSDGFGTRVRLRSYTSVNAVDGTAVSWARQTYYAGLAPSGGLVFPRETAIYPIDPNPVANSRRQRRLIWDDQQRLAAGYLPSRATSQFLVIHAGPTSLKVGVERTADGTGITARNELQTEIRELLVCDAGQCFWGQQLSPGQSAQLQSLESSQAWERANRWLATQELAPPLGFSAPLAQRYYYGNYYGNSIDESMSRPDASASLMEAHLSAAIGTKLPATGRCYFAVTDQAPATVPVGVAAARQVAGFHLIRGQW